MNTADAKSDLLPRRALYVSEGSRGLKSNASTRQITLIGIILLAGFQLAKCRLFDAGANTTEVGDGRVSWIIHVVVACLSDD